MAPFPSEPCIDKRMPGYRAACPLNWSGVASTVVSACALCPLARAAVRTGSVQLEKLCRRRQGSPAMFCVRHLVFLFCLIHLVVCCGAQGCAHRCVMGLGTKWPCVPLWLGALLRRREIQPRSLMYGMLWLRPCCFIARASLAALSCDSSSPRRGYAPRCCTFELCLCRCVAACSAGSDDPLNTRRTWEDAKAEKKRPRALML